jgi:hypothetical protein
MGQEIECRMRFGEHDVPGTAYLEGDHLLFRGEQRLKVKFLDMKSVTANGGVLRLEFAGGPAEFELGPAAEKWAHKILNPPSRLHKLGVKTGMAVRMVGQFDPDFLEELKLCRVEEAVDQADLIFLAAEKTARLALVKKLVRGLKPAGGIWILYPKAASEIREIDVITAGRLLGLKDVKVASFSLTHTGLKFVIPLEKRKG